MTYAEPGGRWGRWAAHPAGPALLFAFAVVEGCLFPAPTEALYAALALGRPRRAWALAALAAAGSVLGGVIAWRIGAASFDRVGRPLLERHGLLPRVDAISALYRRNAALALVTSGYTPIPYLLYGVVGGASGIPLGSFALFSAVGRGLKYVVLAGIARVAGPALRRVLAGHPGRIAAVAALIALAAVAIWLL
jgi:membrane protein YqaA with SNARE-associated domain